MSLRGGRSWLVVGAVLAATLTSCGGPPTAAPAPPLPAHRLSVHIDLSATRVVSGRPLPGSLVVENPNGAFNLTQGPRLSAVSRCHAHERQLSKRAPDRRHVRFGACRDLARHDPSPDSGRDPVRHVHRSRLPTLERGPTVSVRWSAPSSAGRFLPGHRAVVHAGGVNESGTRGGRPDLKDTNPGRGGSAHSAGRRRRGGIQPRSMPRRNFPSAPFVLAYTFRRTTRRP